MKRYYRFIAVFLILFVMALAVLFFVLPDKTYSSSEKRNLTQMPALSFSSLTDGSFMEDFGDYVADQFPLRDFFMKIKTAVSSAAGLKESQGVYACSGDTLMERFDTPDPENEEETLDSILSFAGRYPEIRMYMLLSPNAVSVYPEKLPANALTDDQNTYIDHFIERLSVSSNLTFTDVRSAFEENRDETQIFYRSDHHWTTDGAYIAFKSLASAMSLENVPEFTSSVVTNTFIGSLVSKSGFSVKTPDSIKIYEPVTAEGGEKLLYTVTYVQENEKKATLYDASALDSDNAYDLFLGSNHPLITIDTSAGSGRKLLILKDSYANCFIPFLLSSFDQISVVDPRYYYEDIDALATSGGFTDVLFLYNVNTLSEDTVLKTVLNNNQ